VLGVLLVLFGLLMRDSVFDFLATKAPLSGGYGGIANLLMRCAMTA